jgi:hypothetical protein
MFKQLRSCGARAIAPPASTRSSTRRRPWLAAALALCLLGLAPATGSAASPQGAEKVALHDDFQFLGPCRGAAATPPDTDGFAVINATKSKVSATVALKDGVPGQTYLVHLVQVPTFNGCFVGQHQGELVANEDGNGNAHVAVPRDAGATTAWVYLETAGFFQFITEEVPIR